MGGSVGFPCLNSLDGFNLIFPCAFLSNSCIEMKRDLNLRTSFVNYIKDGEWMDHLIETDNKSFVTDEIFLNRYSFFVNMSPTDVNTPISKRFDSDVTELTNDITQRTESGIEESSIVMKLFSTKTEFRSILLSIMYLLYSKFIPISKLTRKVEEILFHAAIMFDSDDLIAYLADPNSSFVNDFFHVFKKLPLHVIIGSNNSGGNISGSSNSNSGTIIKYSNRDNSLRGQNLYEKYIPNRLIHNNTTTTTSTDIIKKNDDYRVVLVEDNDVSILAHVQLYNSNKMPIYTIFLESNNFDLFTKRNHHSSGFLEHANQVEVLISLLYVLIDY